MQTQTVTLIVAGLGITGTLLGSVLSQWMTRRSQHSLWLRDQRKLEWRELLSRLTETFATIVRLENSVLSPEEKQELDAGKMAANNTLEDRLFIAPDVATMGITEAWTKVLNSVRRGALNEADSRFRDLKADIVVAALKSIE
ncbi:hypothetical protein [Terriglobus sp. TAA 43]|uniref:hypothetical protein n=1 Tax=Terriglobus sp. TAA 43 TaxID=278961 RepID=UPI000648F344|nr:hypothetical protein [Terriglobus sp. TAA 43]